MCRMAILGGDSWITMIGADNGSEGDIKVPKGQTADQEVIVTYHYDIHCVKR